MTHTPRVSVLVPAWNDGAYLDFALRSLAGQQWRDFEVVISDDGSNDDTRAIAAAWVARDERFRSLRSETNLGMAENWNVALRAARGELVTKLDADDAAAPDFLDAMVRELDDPAIGAVFCRTVECDEELRPTATWDGERAFALHGLDPSQRIVRSGHDWLAMSFDDYQLWHSNAFLMRASELRELGGWDDRWSCAADTDLVLRMLEQGRLVVHTPAAGICYRRRRGSVSERAATEGWKQIEGLLVALRSLARVGRPLARHSAAIRQNWWRLWRAAAPVLGDSQLASHLPARQAAKLIPLLDVGPPPLWIRISGDLKALAWHTRRTLFGPTVGPTT